MTRQEKNPACVGGAAIGVDPRPDPAETGLHGAARPGEGQARILLVDDDAQIRDSLGSMLDHLGYLPLLATTGEEALSLLAEGPRPDLVILDMDMPGIGGAGTLPRLRTLHPGLPVVIATGRVHQGVLDLIQRFPRVGLLRKPFGIRELRHHLAEGLGVPK